MSPIPGEWSHGRRRRRFSRAGNAGEGRQAASPLILRGPRMELRTPVPEDDAAMREILSDPLTMRFLPHLRREWTLSDTVARRERLDAERARGEGHALFIHLRREEDGGHAGGLILAGTTGFGKIDLANGTAESGIILHRAHWRRGLATEALYLSLRHGLEELGLGRVDWITSAENESMRGWCEGVLQLTPSAAPAEDDRPGEWICYSLLEPEWRARVGPLLRARVLASANA